MLPGSLRPIHSGSFHSRNELRSNIGRLWKFFSTRTRDSSFLPERPVVYTHAVRSRSFNAPGLRPQALLISFSLLCLVVLLGTKAYSVARTHFTELSELANHDV